MSKIKVTIFALPSFHALHLEMFLSPTCVFPPEVTEANPTLQIAPFRKGQS